MGIDINTPSGKLVLTMLGAEAKLERENIKQKGFSKTNLAKEFNIHKTTVYSRENELKKTGGNI